MWKKGKLWDFRLENGSDIWYRLIQNWPFPLHILSNAQSCQSRHPHCHKHCKAPGNDNCRLGKAKNPILGQSVLSVNPCWLTDTGRISLVTRSLKTEVHSNKWSFEIKTNHAGFCSQIKALLNKMGKMLQKTTSTDHCSQVFSSLQLCSTQCGAYCFSQMINFTAFCFKTMGGKNRSMPSLPICLSSVVLVASPPCTWLPM